MSIADIDKSLSYVRNKDVWYVKYPKTFFIRKIKIFFVILGLTSFNIFKLCVYLMLKYQHKQIVIFKSNFFTTNKQLIQNEPFLSRKQESSETRTIIWKNGFNFDNRAKLCLSSSNFCFDQFSLKCPTNYF